MNKLKCKRCNNKLSNNPFADDLCDNCYWEDVSQDRQTSFSVVEEDEIVNIVLLIVVVCLAVIGYCVYRLFN